MKKSMTLLLAIGALALIAGGYFLVSSLVADDEPPEEDGGTVQTQVLKIDGELAKIDYTYGGERIVLEKNGEGLWQKADDASFPVSADAAETLEAVLGSVEVLREIAPGDADTALFGLDEPQLVVSAAAADGEAVTYRVGIYNSALGGYYALRDGSDAVYLIAEAMPAAFTNGLYSIAAADAYPQISSVNVTDITLSEREHSRRLTFVEGGSDEFYTNAYEWFDVTEGALTPVRETAVTVLASAVTGFEIGECVSHAPDAAELAAYGLNEPSLVCRLLYKLYGTDETAEPAVEEFTLSVGGETDDGGVYVTWSGTEMVFRADKAKADELRAYFDEDLSPKEICTVPLESVEAVEVTAGGKTVRVERAVKTVTTTGESGASTATETAVYTIDGLMADGTAFESFFNALTALEIESTAGSGAYLDTPYLTVRFLRNTAHDSDMTLTFYEHNANFYRAGFNGRQDMLVSVRAVQSLAQQALALG